MLQRISLLSKVVSIRTLCVAALSASILIPALSPKHAHSETIFTKARKERLVKLFEEECIKNVGKLRESLKGQPALFVDRSELGMDGCGPSNPVHKSLYNAENFAETEVYVQKVGVREYSDGVKQSLEKARRKYEINNLERKMRSGERMTSEEIGILMAFASVKAKNDAIRQLMKEISE